MLFVSYLERIKEDVTYVTNRYPVGDLRQFDATGVLVNNGDTTVIGGIYISNQQTNKDGTPGLSRIPILGWLFKRDAVNDEDRELLIFITPRILRG